MELGPRKLGLGQGVWVKRIIGKRLLSVKGKVFLITDDEIGNTFVTNYPKDVRASLACFRRVSASHSSKTSIALDIHLMA